MSAAQPAPTPSPGPPSVRLRLVAHGTVQGVGFRPFIYRLALGLGLRGWVSNSVAGAVVEAEGNRAVLETFLARMQAEKPVHCVLHQIECTWLASVGHAAFVIRESALGDEKTALVLPDLATCADCLRDIFDHTNRRFGYPFTNCTHCGPRFTIIQGLPYDRARTSMRSFPLCPQCEAEYRDPLNRRFHAQPNACPICGPHLGIWSGTGPRICGDSEALRVAGEALRNGAIVAVKGLGGFHLMAAAHRDDAIGRLRERKQREEKPFALMFRCLEEVQGACEVSALESELLTSAQAPIVLLRRRVESGGGALSKLVAPGNPNLGVMLASNPLHHLLLDLLRFPVVATSGNLAEEPICIDESEALQCLERVADLFLVHNRPIVRHADDSIVRVMAGREMVLRRARGYAPLPVQVSDPNHAERGRGKNSPTVLAVGGHLKNSIALAIGSNAFISQHIGDLETPQSLTAFRNVITDFEDFYEARPDLVAADAHPDYLSTQEAHRMGCPVLHVQHHHAHVLACLAEHALDPDALGVAWDGTGYGTDGTIWGGEFLTISETGFERLAYLRTFHLPGGDKAVREPRRSALGLLYEMFGGGAFAMTDCPAMRAFSQRELPVLRRMLEQGVHVPRTSSAGRLFDGVAALLGLRLGAGIEGQAAMDLEFAIEGVESEEQYPIALRDAAPNETTGLPRTVVDWGNAVSGVLEDQRNGLPAGVISAKFHNGLVEAIVQVARRAGKEIVALSGGCFQNKYLTERAILRLQQAGFRPVWHRLVPPNDGGLCLGQVMAARWRMRKV